MPLQTVSPGLQAVQCVYTLNKHYCLAGEQWRDRPERNMELSFQKTIPYNAIYNTIQQYVIVLSNNSIQWNIQYMIQQISFLNIGIK